MKIRSLAMILVIALVAGSASAANMRYQGSGGPYTQGTPVAGMMGLGLIAAACALGGAMVIRKKKKQGLA